MCQLKALLNAMWGEADATRPKLSVVGGTGAAKKTSPETETGLEVQITMRPRWLQQKNGAG